MSDFFDDEEASAEDRPPIRRRRPRLLIALGVLVLLVVAFSIFTSIWTQRLWFDALGDGRVYGTLLGTRVALFGIFGALMALVVAVNVIVAYRVRPVLRQRTPEQAGLDRYRDLIGPMQRVLVTLISVVIGLFAGGSAMGQWRDYLMWAHRQPFHRQDPWFHKDIGFYVFSLPWLHYVVDFLMTATIIALVAALATHYLYGGIRLQSPGDRFSRAAQRHVCVLLAVLVLFKGVAYYLDRFDLTTRSGSLITGMTYTRQHAVLPAQDALMVIAAICAVLFVASIWRSSWLLPGVGIALFAFTAVLLGLIWPAVVQKFQVAPNTAEKERPYIADNMAATRAAYGLEDVSTSSYNGNQSMTPETVASYTPLLDSIRLLDPAVVAQTFQQKQQIRSYYGVPGVLDLDHYRVGGRDRELVVAARELQVGGLQQAQQKWSNEHTVYTHGFGLIAAYSNQRDAQDKLPANPDGTPVWAEKDIPPTGVLGDYQPRIYYGENSPSYSIVGHAPGAKDVELDSPGAGDSANAQTTMYTGPGVEVGSLFHKLLYAVKFGDSNILLSSRVNADSKILYDRSPTQRVAKVAPWLTLDSDPYPTVVGGRILWVVDGYTTSNRFAGAAKRSLSDMTSDATNPRSTFASLPTDQINYIRNSVKATVDAYTGQVTLYAWRQQADPDPILTAMEQAFPGLVQQRIPADLLPHLRYPADLFKVQRAILADYHVGNPTTFYNESDLWEVPNDPSSDTRRQPPYRMDTQFGDQAGPVESLTSVYTPNEKQTLAAYLAVDSDPTSADYGKLQVLRFANDTSLPGPDQVANSFDNSTVVANRLRSFRTRAIKVSYGGLLTVPFDDALLYVQSVYTNRSSGAGSYPTLSFVMASFGDNVGVGNDTESAIADIFHKSSDTTSSSNPGSTTGNGSGTLPPHAVQLLRQADRDFAAADRALKNGDLSTYARRVNDARRLVRQALALGEKSGAKQSSKAGSKAGSEAGSTSAPKGATTPKDTTKGKGS